MKQFLALMMMMMAWPFASFAQEDDDIVINDVEVTCTAGHLSEVLAPHDPKTITGLTIQGEINGTDMVVIRQLCAPAFYDDQNGMLHKLDLSKAKIVAGGSAYYEDVDYGGTGDVFYLEDDKVGDMMFSDCSRLDTLILPETIKEIGNNAFFGIYKLKELNLPATVSKIGNGAFASCSALTGMIIPEGITEIDKRTFSGCKGLKSVVLPSTLLTIKDMAFLGCEGLEEINIPSKVENIGMGAFMLCKNATKLILPDSIKFIGKNTFANDEMLQNIYCKAMTPPVCEDGVFLNVDVNNCKLYVPKGAFEIYRANYTFGAFANIEETEPAADVLVLDEENENNTLTLYENGVKEANVKLTRKLKAGKWQALSLPFALNGEQVKKYFGEEAVLMEPDRLGDVSKGEEEKSIVMKKAEAMEPGKAYFIKPSLNTDVMNFENVKIEACVGVEVIIGDEPNQAFFMSTFNKTDVWGSGVYVLNEDGTLAIVPEKGIENYYVPGFTSFVAVPEIWYGSEVKLILEAEEPMNTLVLDEENENNTLTLYENGVKEANVKLTRKLKAGKWQALSLPFALNGEQVKKYFGEEAVLMEPDRLGDVSKGEEEKSIVMKKAEAMEPGKAYFIKPSVNTDVMNFENVKIEACVGVEVIIGDEPNQAFFMSTFNKTDVWGSGVYVLNEDGTLAIVPEKGIENYYVPGFTSFVAVPEIWYGSEVKLVLDTPTAIKNITDNSAKADNKIYTISGQYAGTSLNGLAKGIYIVNGKKISVK